MAINLSVTEKNIMEFLRDGARHRFLIPDYQRAYEWQNDEINLLFDDLMEFTRSVDENSSEDTYFLGTIVSYVNKNGEREIIDGQQRIMTLSLLLRAIYTKLSQQTPPSQIVTRLLSAIEPTIWKQVDEMTGSIDKTQNFIRSESIDDNYKDVLQSILTTGKPVVGTKSLYSKNYRLLQKLYDNLYKDQSAFAERFAHCLLNKTFVFSIEASTRNKALTIFSTINNRGKSLSDADILRAKIYSSIKSDAAKSEFNDNWRALIKHIDEIGETIEDILSYYMYYVRALDGDTNQTMKGLKRYFTRDDSKRNEGAKWLESDNVMGTLKRIVNMWGVVNKREIIEDEPWSEDTEILQLFDVMRTFQNYSWRSAAVVYYLVHVAEPDFLQNYLSFLRKLISQYVPIYILNVDRTFLRARILKLDVSVIKSAHPIFEFQISPANDLSLRDNINRLKNSIKLSNNAIIRKVLLKMLAYTYSDQSDLLPSDAEVEHIMPQKWEAIYSSRGYDKEKFAEYVEQIGNLTLLESSLNRKISNAPFEIKKETYLDSKIAMARELIDEPDEWTPDAIAIRSNKLAELLIELWQRWSDEYDQSM